MRERSRKYHTFFLAAALFLFSASTAYTKEVPYALEDRERIIRLEEGLKALNQRLDGVERTLNQRIDDTSRSINGRIGELRDLMLWGFGVTFAGIFTLIGFVLWDRRTALAPAVRRTADLESRGDKMEAALREFASKSPSMADSLKKVGLLR